MSVSPKFDVCIIGSSFGGSILAWALCQAGRSVILVDRNTHPRFAIGESSTPLADFLLERIASEFGLTELATLSRWGSWQAHHPELRAGKKRGFSYFNHQSHQPFFDDSRNNSSLLVAASSSDAKSDTHWLRSDIDRWLCEQAKASGADLFSNFHLSRCAFENDQWVIDGNILAPVAQESQAVSFRSRFIVDCSGNGQVVGNAIGLTRLDDQLLTQTGAVFGHFENVSSMTELLSQDASASTQEASSCKSPFDPDDAAQHHMLDKEIWLWMLRFTHNVTSVGIVGDTKLLQQASPHRLWAQTLEQYPTIAKLLQGAQLIAPLAKNQPSLGAIQRISRLWEQAAGPHWAMLPSTAGIVDPLHSTGIAHTLSGVLRLARILCADGKTPATDQLLKYSHEVVREVRWIDRIVSTCYCAQSESFEMFCAACSIYFLSAIHCERESANSGTWENGFLFSQSDALHHICVELNERIAKVIFEQDLSKRTRDRKHTIDWLRIRLSRWNDVGLMDPSLKNRIARSTAPK